MATYADLETRLKNWSADKGTDFATEIPTGIAQAENEISRQLGFESARIRTTGAMVIGENTFDKPATTIVIRYITITVSGRTVFLHYRKLDYLKDYAPDPTSTAQPRFWSNQDDTTDQKVYVAPTPDVAYPYLIESEIRIAGLSSTNQTTWLSENYDDLLFYFAILQMVKFDKHSDGEARWTATAQRELEACRAEIARLQSDAGNLRRQ